MKKQLRFLLVSIAASCACFTTQAQVLFSDNFDTDTSANWTIRNDSSDLVADYTVLFAFDYSTNKFVRNGVTNTIPPAPNGGGKGVKMWVNKNDAIGTNAAVSLFPNGQSFSDNYALKFDMWLNYPGGFQGAGSAGSTEFATFGVNHSGNFTVWTNTSDGVWFGVTGEAGAARDYRSYVGDGTAPSFESIGFSGGFLDRNNDGVVEQEVFSDPSTAPLKLMFPAPQFESDGMPGKQWVQVEVRQRTNDSGTLLVTWLMNNYVIAEHSNGAGTGQTAGNIMIGNMDIFPSIASPAADSFVLYDNLRVVDLDGVAPLPVVQVVPNVDGAEPNFDGGFTISRTGDTSAPLTVTYKMSGSASNGLDYVSMPGTVTIAAGETATNVTLTVNNDAIGEATETATLFLTSSVNYDLYGTISATINITDDNDLPTASLRVTKTNAYELNPLNEGRFTVSLSNPSSDDVTLNFATGGTAVNGTDYSNLVTSVTIPAGLTNALIRINPINNTNIDGNRTVILTLTNGTGYALSTNLTGTVTIRNDDLPPGTGLFSENFDTDPTSNWTVNNGPSDGSSDFFFDYSSVGIPPAPNSTGGSTRGLKLQANMTTSPGVFSGISVSPIGQNFSNDYRLRFDMWCNYHGAASGGIQPGGTGSTQLTGGGIGTVGTSPQWPGNADSVYFMVTGDGQSTVDYRAYSPAATTGYTEPSGVYAAGTSVTAPTARDNLNPYYNEFGRQPAPEAQLANYPNQTAATTNGAQGFVWRDVAIVKQGTNITFSIDGKLIATVGTTNGMLKGGNILLNQSDINPGTSATDPNAISLQFGLIDNVRVESLTVAPPQRPNITGINVAGGTVTINFTGASSDLASAFKLQSSATVGGTYADDNSALITGSGGTFQASTSASGATRFYRIKR